MHPFVNLYPVTDFVTMYDNVHMRLGIDEVGDNGILTKVPNYLESISEHYYNDGNYCSISGYLGCLGVTVTPRNVKISNSLCRYYLGDNFQTLTRKDSEKAIERISDELHLPFCRATVTRIDFAQNYIMRYPESVYYNYLGDAQYYTRLEQNNGIYYQNGLRQLVFYGKVYEQKVKGQYIPEVYQNRNTIRYEFRLKKRLPQQLRRPEIKVNLLYDEDFYIEMVDRWKREYFSINKLNSILKNMEPTGSSKILIDQFASMKINEFGQASILKLVTEWQKKGEINRKQASDLKKKIRNVSNDSRFTYKNEIIEELDKKVKESARFYR